MNETEWLTSSDGFALFDYLYPRGDRPPPTRKLRLYLIALCRLAWNRLPAACRATTVFAEHHTDDPRPDPYTCNAVFNAAARITLEFANPEAIAQCERDLRAVGLEVATGPSWRGSADEWSRYTWLALMPHALPGRPHLGLPDADHQPDLIRCIFGNPFRPVAFDAEWRTRTATELARSMYEERDFAAMPILADALEEAGCDDADILAHCREPGPHARGCWVVDGLLQHRW